MSRYELLSLLVAAIAIVISLVSLSRTYRLARRQLELQEEQAVLSRLQHKALEEEQEQKRRADVRVSLALAGGTQKFIFENVGLGAARNVEFGFLGANRPVLAAQFGALFPIQRLRPGEQVSLAAVLTMETPPVFDGIISWDDEFGRRQEQKCKITR